VKITNHKATQSGTKAARATRNGGTATATASAPSAPALNDYAARVVSAARDKRAAQLRAARAARRAPAPAQSWRERARARIARARAHFASNRALANHARTLAARTAPAPFATSERREVVREIAGGNASHPQRASAGKRWPCNARLSRACVLVQGRAVYWREGESARAALARIVQPCASAPARAVQLRAARIAPHLSPSERARLDAHTLASVRAIAPAPAPDESAPAPREPWHFSAHLSPREQRLKRALNVSRRKCAARAEFCADMQTRAALARALREVSRDVARGALARFVRARFARARAVQRERRAVRAACAIAGQRARFHSLGALVLRERETGKRIGRKAARTLAPATGAESFNATESGAHILRGAFTLDARDGTGRAVEWQAVCEMRLAARAELLAGNGWKAANKSAARELHRALREPLFADVATASRARDKAHARAREVWESETSAGVRSDEQPQPHGAEFLAENDAESALAPARVLYRRALHGMRCAVAYWRASKSPYARRGVRADIGAIRAHALALLESAPRELLRAALGEKSRDTATDTIYRAAHRLGERVCEGAELLAKQASAPRQVREVRAGIPPRAPVATVTLPRGRAEHYEQDAPALALRLLAKLHARTAHGCTAKGESRAGKAAQVSASKARTVRALRAPLPPCALGALAEWQPSAGK
jgi:hypothetical protein